MVVSKAGLASQARWGRTDSGDRCAVLPQPWGLSAAEWISAYLRPDSAFPFPFLSAAVGTAVPRTLIRPIIPSCSSSSPRFSHLVSLVLSC